MKKLWDTKKHISLTLSTNSLLSFSQSLANRFKSSIRFELLSTALSSWSLKTELTSDKVLLFSSCSSSFTWNIRTSATCWSCKGNKTKSIFEKKLCYDPFMYVGYCVSLSRAFIMFIECVTKQLFLLNVFFQSRKCKLRVKSFWLRKRVRAAKSFFAFTFFFQWLVRKAHVHYLRWAGMPWESYYCKINVKTWERENEILSCMLCAISFFLQKFEILLLLYSVNKRPFFGYSVHFNYRSVNITSMLLVFN